MKTVTFGGFIDGYEQFLHYVAEFTIHTMELIGIIIIILGSINAIVRAVNRVRKKETSTVVIDLGKALALALEFKMGAEIVNTVIIRDLRELGVLAIVIALRAILALLIYWEIKNEKKEELEKSQEKEKNS